MVQGYVLLEGSYPGPFPEDLTPCVLRDMSLEINLKTLVTRNVWSFLKFGYVMLFLLLL